MGFEKPADYNEVQDRIIEFREKHPEGSLQADDPIWLRDGKGEPIGVTIRTFAYRTPDDPRPGVGTAYEQFPGKTPYTKGSEVMNAETSAWGRALIAAGAADAKKGIASANEVRNARANNEQNGSGKGGGNSGGSRTRSQGTRGRTQGGSKPPAESDPSPEADPSEFKRALVKKLLAARKVPPSALKEFLAELGSYSGLSAVSDLEHLDSIRNWVEQSYPAGAGE